MRKPTHRILALSMALCLTACDSHKNERDAETIPPGSEPGTGGSDASSSSDAASASDAANSSDAGSSSDAANTSDAANSSDAASTSDASSIDASSIDASSSDAGGAGDAGDVDNRPLPSGPPFDAGAATVPEFKPAFPEQTRAPGMKTERALEITEIASGFNAPWAIAFLPDKRML